jgi:hypothetical protein
MAPASSFSRLSTKSGSDSSSALYLQRPRASPVQYVPERHRLRPAKSDRSLRRSGSLIKFDSRRIEKVCVAVPVSQVAELTMESYQPGASTPLIDAAYKTIKAVEKSLNGSNPKVVVYIQTDGHENASTEHTWDELNALIKEKTAAGWQFNFLGTGIDAYDTGARMGVAAMSTMSSGRSPQHVRASYAAMGESTAAYAAGRARDTHLLMDARAASGDAHFQRVFGQQGSEKPKPQSPPIPSQPKHKAVDDFSL